MLKIKEGEPWVMWPNNLVDNFLEFPSNRIFDYNCDFEFKLDFELIDEIITKSTLFAKLPSYLGLDLESEGILFILSEEGLDTKYISHQHNWEVGKKYSLLLKRVNKTLTIDLDSITIIQIDVTTSIPNDSNSHIVFGSGNFPQNGFNLNYLSVILHYLSIKKEGVLISEHLFKKFINNKSLDETNNCNFIYKI
jgi:hypothetical protein